MWYTQPRLWQKFDRASSPPPWTFKSLFLSFFTCFYRGIWVGISLPVGRAHRDLFPRIVRNPKISFIFHAFLETVPTAIPPSLLFDYSPDQHTERALPRFFLASSFSPNFCSSSFFFDLRPGKLQGSPPPRSPSSARGLVLLTLSVCILPRPLYCLDHFFFCPRYGGFFFSSQTDLLAWTFPAQRNDKALHLVPLRPSPPISEDSQE